MDSILIQIILNNNREHSKFNQNQFKTYISNLLQQKFFITHRRVNRVIYIDILYPNNIVINKDSIINIVKNVFTSIARLYIGIIERPIDN